MIYQDIDVLNEANRGIQFFFFFQGLQLRLVLETARQKTGIFKNKRRNQRL